MKKIFFALFCLALACAACDLFNPLPEGDLQAAIEENVRWANAARLSVTVHIPSGWGTSPQLGTNKCYDNKRTNETPRQGYAFTVEFTPSSSFGFERWLAFRTADYAALDFNKSAAEIASSALNGDEAAITESESATGAKIANITINITEPVTLVPWCSNRLTVTRSNPPLIPSLSAFPYDQKISLWFNMAVKPDSVIMGETIRVSATYLSGDRLPFEKISGNVAITDGDISQYFEASFPEPLNQPHLVVLSVKKSEEHPDYPAEDLRLLDINVEVGPGVQNLNGLTMPARQAVSYRTNASAA